MHIFRALIAATMLAVLGGCASKDWYGDSYPAAAPQDGVNATFLGVSTLVFEYRGHAIATDGFFSRPDAIDLIRVEPDKVEIDRIWKAVKIASKLDAVITTHSHYDHAMDAPVLAESQDATLIGSRSTQFIAEGVEFPGSFRLIHPAKPTTFLVPEKNPVFRVTTIRSKHGDTPFSDESEIKEKLVPPVFFTKYKEGGCFSIFIEFLESGRTVLVHSSAGYLQGALKGFKADVVYLGIVPLGDMKDEERDAYWNEVVTTVGAKRVFPIHWDYMFDRLEIGEEELRPFRPPAHNFDAAMKYLKRKERDTGVQVVLPRAWRKTDPFPPPESAAAGTTFAHSKDK